MKKQKREFPYVIYLAIGVMWILIGVIVMSGLAVVLWILAGLVFVTIGFLGMRKKSKQPISKP